MASSTSTPIASSTQPGSNIDYERFLDCVHCGLCTASCPTYLETGNENDSPRGRIYLMRAVVDQRIELTSKVEKHLDLCLDCRACETACPSGVNYGRLIEPFRTSIRDKGDWFERWILHWLLPNPKRMRLALAPVRFMQFIGLDGLIRSRLLTSLLPGKKLKQLHAMLPPPQKNIAPLRSYYPAKGKKRATVALFEGCVSDIFFRHTNRATTRVLQENGCDVHIPTDQGCCGAIHYHSGSDQPAINFAKSNCVSFNPDQYDAIIVNVAGCGSMLKDYPHLAAENAALSKSADFSSEMANRFSSKVKDISEFLLELGPRPPEGAIPLTATYHDACHLAHAQQIREAPRKLLEMIPELNLVPLEESEICCGAAGTYNLTEPEMSDRLAKRKLDRIGNTKAQAVFTSNAGCLLQIAKQSRLNRNPLWVAHPIDILDMSYRGLQPSHLTSTTDR